MSKLLSKRTFAPGDRIFIEGAAGTHAYVLQEGRVRIEKKSARGERFVLGHVEPGGIFGEMALIDDSPRMATAIAEGGATCVLIPKDALRRKLADADPVIRMLILMLIRMIRTVAEHGHLRPEELAALAASAAADKNEEVWEI